MIILLILCFLANFALLAISLVAAIIKLFKNCRRSKSHPRLKY